MKLSVIMPVFNERNTIQTIVDQVEAVSIDKEVLIVDDASTDGTREFILSRYGQRPGFKVILHEKNKGKGSSIRTAIEHISGDAIIIQDADLEYDPQDFIAISKKLEEPGVQVVYGTRFGRVNKFLFLWHWLCGRFQKKHYEIRYLHHFLGIQFLNLLTNVLYAARITDEATCYKAFKKEVLEKIRLRSTGFEFCPEITAKVRKAGYPIFEVPIAYRPRSRKEGKKLTWRHGLEAIAALIKYRFVD